MRVRPTRPAIYRLTRIHEEIGSGSFPSAPRLAGLIEVSSRTIQRDIEYMRDVLGMRIGYDPAKHGYFYFEDGVELPTPRLSEGELVAVLVGTKVLAQYAGTPFEADLRRAFSRIAELLPEEATLHLTELADATAFSVTAPRPADIELFRKLVAAVRLRRRLRIVCESLSGGRSAARLVDPYKMACVNAAWYLVAYCHKRREVRLFVPDRIREIEETGEEFEAPAEFDFEKYMKGAFGVMRGGRARRVRLRFTGMAAHYVPERVWHPTQKVRSERETSVLEMTVTGLDSVARWAMSFGGECEVLAPAELRCDHDQGRRAVTVLHGRTDLDVALEHLLQHHTRVGLRVAFALQFRRRRAFRCLILDTAVPLDPPAEVLPARALDEDPLARIPRAPRKGGGVEFCGVSGGKGKPTEQNQQQIVSHARSS